MNVGALLTLKEVFGEYAQHPLFIHTLNAAWQSLCRLGAKEAVARLARR